MAWAALGIGNHSRFPSILLIGDSKTQIALAYVFWLRKTYPEVSVFWIHASNAERFRQAYTLIAQECQVPGYGDPKIDVLALVKRWLERRNGDRWLMVIDNADDVQTFFGQQQQMEPTDTTDTDSLLQEENLGRYVPECPNGAILVTTRNLQAGVRLTKGKRPIEVRKMGEDETQRLLRTRLDGINITPDESSALSSRLEHLPLALVQAAAFIQENATTISEYLRLLERSDQHLVDLLSEEFETFETVGRDSETPRAVAETWICSFEQIQRQNVLASELLSLMSLFDRQAIPLEFLSHYGEQQNREPRGAIQLTKALGVLKGFSFLAEDRNRRFDMHRLVQLVTRKWLIKRGKMSGFAEQALIAVSQAYPDGSYENRAICSAYLPHAYSVLGFEGSGSRDERLARASLLHCAAGFFLYQGQWKDTERFLAEAKGLRQGELGEEHPSTLACMAKLASTYRKQGRWKEAEELGVQVIETGKKVLGEEHPDTLTSMANLASTYRNQGRWKEAEELEVQVMETRKKVLGEEHPSTLTSMANLALTWKSQGRLNDALELMQNCLHLQQQVLGPDHPDTVSTLSTLTNWLDQKAVRTARMLR